MSISERWAAKFENTTVNAMRRYSSPSLLHQDRMPRFLCTLEISTCGRRPESPVANRTALNPNIPEPKLKVPLSPEISLQLAQS